MLKEHVILTFLTHAPNALVISLYTLTVYCAEHAVPHLYDAAILLAALWATIVAFEFSYKTRAPKDETALQTYSKVLGYKPAILWTLVFLATATACMLFVIVQAELSRWALVVVGAFALAAAASCIRFLDHSASKGQTLAHRIGQFWYTACSATVIAALCARGMAFGR